MKKAIGICTALLLGTGTSLAQEEPEASRVRPPPVRAANAESIAAVKSVGNLLKGMRNDPTPWECEPTLLYAAEYPLPERDMEYVLDYCSVLALNKRHVESTNIFDNTANVARERPKTEQKLQRYRDAKQFYLEVSGIRIVYEGKPGHYRLAWRVPQLEVLHQATTALAKAYIDDIPGEKIGSPFPGRYNSMALAEDYKRSGMEFFDRKYGKGASVSLNRPVPWPAVDQLALSAADEKTAYALENLTNNPPQREIDGTTFFQLGITGNLFFSVEPSGDVARVAPLFLEVWLYKKVVRIPLDDSSYTINCRQSGLFGKSFKCE